MSGFHDWAYMVIAIGRADGRDVRDSEQLLHAAAHGAAPSVLERALKYAPVCALTAIVAPAVFTRDHQPYISWHNHQMWALLAAGLVFARWRNMTAMIVVGMAVFTVLRLWA